ncbi:hypothetical protein MIDIC_110074 [Alphaproteobacteria bacterium]
MATGLIDMGFFGQITLQIYATQPIRIYPGMLIGQIAFWKPDRDIKLYNGKYQNSIGPVSSKIFKDFQ